MPPRPRSAGVTCDVGEVGESEALRVWDSAASRRRQDGDAEVDEVAGSRSHHVRPRPYRGYRLGGLTWTTTMTRAFPNSPRRHAARCQPPASRVPTSSVLRADLRKLHGMGPSVITALREALQERGLWLHRGVPAPGQLEGRRGPPTWSTSTCVVSRSRAAARFRRCAARSFSSSRTRKNDLLPRSRFPGRR